MKKKWTALLLTGTVLLNLTACAGGGSDSAPKGADKKAAQETEISYGVKDAWKDILSAQPVVNGDKVSYGPITMDLPPGYLIGSKDLSDKSFYPTDALQSDYVPHIDFTNQLGMAAYSPGMEDQLEKHMQDTLSEQGAQFKEIVNYEESKLEGYGVIRATVGYTYDGKDLVDEIYQLYETSNEYGSAVSVEYYGKADDEQHLAEAKEAMDSISLITGAYETRSLVNAVSGWDNAFNSIAGALTVDGASVKFGPLHIDLPEGYTVEDETAEEPAFYGLDGMSNYSFSRDSNSYYLMSDRNYMNSTFLQEYAKAGYENINLVTLDTMEVSGHKTVRAVVDSTYQGMQISQLFYLIFEEIDAVVTPCITVIYSGTGGQGGTNEQAAAAFDSMRID